MISNKWRLQKMAKQLILDSQNSKNVVQNKP